MRKYVCSVLVERGSQLRGFVCFGESLGSFGISHESYGTPALLYLSTAGSAGIILAVASFNLRCEGFIVLPAQEKSFTLFILSFTVALKHQKPGVFFKDATLGVF